MTGPAGANAVMRGSRRSFVKVQRTVSPSASATRTPPAIAELSPLGSEQVAEARRQPGIAVSVMV